MAMGFVIQRWVSGAALRHLYITNPIPMDRTLGPVSPKMHASPQTLFIVVTHERVSYKLGRQRPGTVS